MSSEAGHPIPPLGAHIEGPYRPLDERKPYVRLFTPYANWSWYIMEWDPETGICFGMVQGVEEEFGEFSLDELSEITLLAMPAVERDRYWQPQTIGELKSAWQKLRSGEAYQD